MPHLLEINPSSTRLQLIPWGHSLVRLVTPPSGSRAKLQAIAQALRLSGIRAVRPYTLQGLCNRPSNCTRSKPRATAEALGVLPSWRKPYQAG
jgi:hypothetical protein